MIHLCLSQNSTYSKYVNWMNETNYRLKLKSYKSTTAYNIILYVPRASYAHYYLFLYWINRSDYGNLNKKNRIRMKFVFALPETIELIKNNAMSK